MVSLEAIRWTWEDCGDSGGGSDSLKLGAVEIRALRGRRKVAGSIDGYHCFSTAARLMAR